MYIGRWDLNCQYSLAINTLHCMTKQTKPLKVRWPHDCHVMSCDLQVHWELRQSHSHARPQACTHTCTHTHTHTRTHAHTHARTHAHTRACTHTHTTCVCVCIVTFTHAYMHAYTYTGEPFPHYNPSPLAAFLFHLSASFYYFCF